MPSYRVLNPGFGSWSEPEDGENRGYRMAPWLGDNLDLAVANQGSWHRLAACAKSDLSFVDIAGHVAALSAVCARCPVSEACLRDAMREEEGLPEQMRAAMRGGLTPSERCRLAERTAEVDMRRTA